MTTAALAGPSTVRSMPSWSLPRQPALVDELVGQLAEGGRLVAPVGGPGGQSLVQLDRRPDGSIEQRVLAPVTFVPLLSGMLD